MTTKPKDREDATPIRLRLECRCGKVQTLSVHPDAPVLSVAKAHGWGLRQGQWECPKCVEVTNELASSKAGRG